MDELTKARAEIQRLHGLLKPQADEIKTLKDALRKAVSVWNNYRIDSTEMERGVLAECQELLK